MLTTHKTIACPTGKPFATLIKKNPPMFLITNKEPKLLDNTFKIYRPKTLTPKVKLPKAAQTLLTFKIVKKTLNLCEPSQTYIHTGSLIYTKISNDCVVNL